MCPNPVEVGVPLLIFYVDDGTVHPIVVLVHNRKYSYWISTKEVKKILTVQKIFKNLVSLSILS